MEHPTFRNTHFQSSMNEGSSSSSSTNMPSSLLFTEEQAFNPPFTSSSPSPSLDMEVALEQLMSSSSSCDSELSSSPNATMDGRDVLMADPFLDFLNEMLMAEGEQANVPCVQHDVEASYLAIVRSLYDIVGECLPLDSTSSVESAVKPSSTDISFEEFKYRAGLTDLYIGRLSLSDTSTTSSASTNSSSSKDKKRSSRAATTGYSTAQVGQPLDLRELLVSCARAVAMGDVKKAREILQEVYQVHGASVKGNALQRTAHYFGDALFARMGGMGGHQYRLMCENMPSMVPFLRASRIWYGRSPYVKIMHYFATQSILNVAKGASRLHILDYGMFYGVQWPCLINLLADREGGPPLLVITGIDCSKPGKHSWDCLEESGCRLAAYAKTYNVPFKFHVIVSDHWEDIDPASFQLQEGEVLVVNCLDRLRQHADESTADSTLSSICPRQKLLISMRSLNPHLLLISERNYACNSSSFLTRFQEALYFYSNLVDMHDTVWGDEPDLLFTETRCVARDILNIVACEGAERVDRPETYKQWDARIRTAGFELLPIPSVILSRSRFHVREHYHKDFFVYDDGKGWMLLGWKGRIIFAMSTWKSNV